jgi:hypothetical protein
MGIQDRNYYRSDTRTPPRHSALPGWSVTTWIIAVCVAVFVIDGFLKPVPEPVRSELAEGISAEQMRKLDRREFQFTVPEPIGGGAGRGLAVLGGSNPVARIEYRYQLPLTRAGYFSTSRAVYSSDPVLGISGFEVWRFITFQFLHANLNHILFNMMTLFFFGGMVEQFLGSKRFLAFYLLCGISGGLMYLLLNGLAIGGQAAFGPGFHLPGSSSMTRTPCSWARPPASSASSWLLRTWRPTPPCSSSSSSRCVWERSPTVWWRSRCWP